MGRLRTDKQEKFATYLANGYSQVAAYKEAGYLCKNSTASANASKLANDEDVMKRVEELKIKAAEKALTSTAPPLPLKKDKTVDVDLDWFNREYIQLLNMAKESQDLKNAVAILRDMSELNKIRPEPEADNNTNRNRMLPSNDKSNLGNSVKISIFDKESSDNGGTSNGFVEITVPDPDPVSDSDYTTYEDLGPA